MALDMRALYYVALPTERSEADDVQRHEEDIKANENCLNQNFSALAQKIYEFESYYDEKNVFVWKRETKFEYFDNGVVSREFSEKSNSQIKVEKLYDENGNLKVKIEHRGAVKTFFDKDDKPFKREIDRGSGGVVTEEL